MRHLSLTTIFILLFSFQTFAQSTDYYYPDNGKAQYFNVTKKKILINVSNGFDSKSLAQKFQVEQVWDNYFVVTNNEKDIDKNDLKGFPNILSANYFLTENVAPTGVLMFAPAKAGGLSKTTLSTLEAKFRITITSYHPKSNRYVAHLNPDAVFTAITSAGKLYEEGIFKYCEPDFIFLNGRNTNDTYYNQQWNIDKSNYGTSLAGEDLNVPGAWANATGSGVIVAVIDDGVDLGHQDLQNNLVTGKSIGTSGAGQQTGNAAHGTAVSGVIAARANNGKGIAGIAYNAKIMPIRAAVTNQQTADAIEYAVDNGADVINMSFGSQLKVYDGSTWYWMPEPWSVNTEITLAVTNGRGGDGCILVASSGNEGISSPVQYPARNTNVIAVNGYHTDGIIFGNSGSEIDVCAPGNDVPSLDVSGSAGYSTTEPSRTFSGSNDYLKNFNGTSVASPQVAAIAALILEEAPCLTYTEVKDAIKSSTGNSSAINNERGFGTPDATAAINTLNNGLTISGSITGGPAEACPDDIITYQVTPPSNPAYGYTWEASGGALINGVSSPVYSGSYTTNSNSVNIDINGKDGGSIVIRVRANNACGGGGNWVSLVQQITKLPTTPTDIIAVSGDLCPGNHIILETPVSNSHTSYTWYEYSNLVTPVTNTSLPVNQKEFAISGTLPYATIFKVEANNACGTSPLYTEAMIKNSNVVANYVPNIVIPTSYCGGYSNTFYVSNPYGGIQYEWVFDAAENQYDHTQTGLGLTSYTPYFGRKGKGNVPVYVAQDGGRPGGVSAYTIKVRYRDNCGGWSAYSTVSVGSVIYNGCNGHAHQITTGGNGNGQGNSNIKLIPNPATNLVSVEIPQGTGNATIRITDGQGNLKKSIISSSTTEIIDISQLPLGVYNVTVVKDQTIYNKHLQIIH